LEPLPSAVARAGDGASRLPPGFDAWLARCLDLDASSRYQSASSAVNALLQTAGLAPAGEHAPAGGQAPTAVQEAAVLRPSMPSQPLGTTTQPGASTLGAWAAQKRMQLREPGEVQTYANWMQYQFVPKMQHVVREGRVQLGDADVLVGEIVIQDELRRAVGEAHMLVAIVSYPRLQYNVAVRTKKLTSLGDGLSRGLRALDQFVSSKPKDAPLLGDPRFESKFEVRGPSPREAAMALPVAVRQFLMQTGFAGIVETRPGRLAISQEPARFDATTVDLLLDTTRRLLDAFA
jgi:hypothetical protein